jgi:putative intracellular protease/amidase
MQIALALYPNFTMLDIVGPFQVLADVPSHEVEFVAAERGPVVDHTGRGTLIATRTFADVAEFDAGSPAKAPAALVDLVQALIGEGPALPATTGGTR